MKKSANKITAAKANREDTNGLGRYFNEIRKSEPLSREVEYETALRWRDDKCPDARTTLLNSNLRFVVKVSLEYRNYGFAINDLIQEGNVGLLKALNNFDPEKGYRFISYAVWWIKAQIQEYILTNWSLVKIGTTQRQRKMFNKLMSSQYRAKMVISEQKKDETMGRIADEAGATVKEAISFEQRIRTAPVFLDAPVRSENGEGRDRHETLDLEVPDTEHYYARAESKQFLSDQISSALTHLDERDRVIIQKRYLGEEKATLLELGDELRISKERVRQLEGRALLRLKDFFSKQDTLPEMLAVAG